MSVYVSLHQLLLSQMGYLLFYELNQINADTETIMQRLQTLHTAIENIKSYQNNTHFTEMINNFDFDLDEEELTELKRLNLNENECTNYLHPFGFGMWAQDQTFIDLQWTGTMDDSETTKDLWRQLTGASFMKQWKKQKISKQQIIKNYNSEEHEAKEPFIDISIAQNSVVKVTDFRLSLCHNRIFQISLPQSLCRKSRASVDHGLNGANPRRTKKSPKVKRSALDKASGINLFDTVINQNTLRIACCILWQPELAQDILSEFISEPAFNTNGSHKKLEEISPHSAEISTEMMPMSVGVIDENGIQYTMYIYAYNSSITCLCLRL